jgi:hypothetical protein
VPPDASRLMLKLRPAEARGTLEVANVTPLRQSEPILSIMKQLLLIPTEVARDSGMISPAIPI